MTIPFLEVVLHTANEYKNKTKSHIVPETRVDVVKVTYGEENEDTKTNNTMKLTLSMVMGNLMLPIRSSPVRYVLKIHFFIESGLKMIQFKT